MITVYCVLSLCLACIAVVVEAALIIWWHANISPVAIVLTFVLVFWIAFYGLGLSYAAGWGEEK